MKRPFCSVALFLAGGVILGDWFSAYWVWPLGLGAACALGAMFSSKLQLPFLAAALVFAGWFNMARLSAVVSPCDLRQIMGQEAQLVSLRGALCQAPKERIFERDQEESMHSTALVDVRQIKRQGSWQPACGTVSVSTLGILDEAFFPGQTVEIEGVIHPPAGPDAPGLFDMRTFLQRQSVYYQLSAQTNDWRVWQSDPPQDKPLSTRFHAWAKKTLSIGLPEEDQPQRLMWTLMLDWRAPLTQPVQEPFVKSGTFHIFAVDGLRIGIIASILIVVCRMLRFPRWLDGLIVIPAIWFYAGLTGFPSSAVRAAIMLTVVDRKSVV